VKVDPALRNFPYSGTEQCRMSFVVSCSHEIECLEKVSIALECIHLEDLYWSSFKAIGGPLTL
jgi:hypothetical protein